MMTEFLNSLSGKTFKILPIYEENYTDFFIYLNNLKIELVGATLTFPTLKNNKYYIDILNIVNYLCENEVDHETCKRQVFKCRDLIEKVCWEDNDYVN